MINSDIKPANHSFKKFEAIINVENIKIKGNTYAQKTAFKPNAFFKTTFTSSLILKESLEFNTSTAFVLDSEIPHELFARQESQCIFCSKLTVIV